ncbi:MAG: 4-hydroxybutyrate CoA-transferase [Bacteroidales bacterium]|nr:4-hydroxybutyrate CoA-transferase [Bacteroidales bacterium]
MYKAISPEEAVKVIEPGNRVFIHSVALAPKVLIDAMVARAPELHDVSLLHIHTEGSAPYVDEKYEGIFHLDSYFVGANVRKATQAGRADYIPVFLSETPQLIREDILPIDVAMVQVSPPDKHGYVSLGTSIDCSLAAVQKARHVIAVVNKHVPRAWGDGILHISEINSVVEHDSPLIEAAFPEPSAVEQKIGQNCAELIDNGATLQMGIGAIPNAVLASLGNHKNLGVHTEMFSDGLIPLVEKGIVNNREKKLDRGRTVASFLMGTSKTYNFVDDNPGVAMRDVAYTNSVAIIRQQPKMTAINSAVEIDITGQVCADSIGCKHHSGVGGQVDFVRGAGYSEGGKPIIAVPSTTKDGSISKITPLLKQGAGVVTTRANMHWVVTEYGTVDLYGKNLQQRARALINIAHPKHRESLEQAAFERFGPHFLKVGKPVTT